MKAIAGSLAVALIAALAVIAWFYPRASLPLTYPGDEKLIARAMNDRAKAFGKAAPPVAMAITHERAGQRCVEFRTGDRMGAGTYQACYDRSGKKVEESLNTGF